MRPHAYPLEIRRVLYTTNMIESLNARLRKATRNRGAFPSEQAALKTLYLTIRTMTRSDGANGITRSDGWKATLNAFAIQFGDRININR
nr:transposase [Prauserella sp. PE36]